MSWVDRVEDLRAHDEAIKEQRGNEIKDCRQSVADDITRIGPIIEQRLREIAGRWLPEITPGSPAKSRWSTVFGGSQRSREVWVGRKDGNILGWYPGPRLIKGGMGEVVQTKFLSVSCWGGRPLRLSRIKSGATDAKVGLASPRLVSIHGPPGNFDL